MRVRTFRVRITVAPAGAEGVEIGKIDSAEEEEGVSPAGVDINDCGVCRSDATGATGLGTTLARDGRAVCNVTRRRLLVERLAGEL
jgi:hypothetical protein